VEQIDLRSPRRNKSGEGYRLEHISLLTELGCCATGLATERLPSGPQRSLRSGGGEKSLGEELDYQVNREGKEVALRLRRIATVVNGVTETPEDWRKVRSKLVFEKEYVDALFGLGRHERIWVIFGFNHQRGWTSRVRPRRAKDKSLVGVFASRSIQRPNKLGLTLVDLASVKGNTVTVKGLDAFDGSPVYDVKNYDEDYDD